MQIDIEGAKNLKLKSEYYRLVEELQFKKNSFQDILDEKVYNFNTSNLIEDFLEE